MIASSKIVLFSSHFKKDNRSIHHVKIAQLIEYFIQKRKEMIKTYSILSENFLNAAKTAYTLHAELNRPPEYRRQQSRA